MNRIELQLIHDVEMSHGMGVSKQSRQTRKRLINLTTCGDISILKGVERHVRLDGNRFSKFTNMCSQPAILLH